MSRARPRSAHPPRSRGPCRRSACGPSAPSGPGGDDRRARRSPASLFRRAHSSPRMIGCVDVGHHREGAGAVERRPQELGRDADRYRRPATRAAPRAPASTPSSFGAAREDAQAIAFGASRARRRSNGAADGCRNPAYVLRSRLGVGECRRRGWRELEVDAARLGDERVAVEQARFVGRWPRPSAPDRAAAGREAGRSPAPQVAREPAADVATVAGARRAVEAAGEGDDVG